MLGELRILILCSQSAPRRHDFRVVAALGNCQAVTPSTPGESHLKKILGSDGWILRDGAKSAEAGAMDEIAEVFQDPDDPRTGNAKLMGWMAPAPTGVAMRHSAGV